MTCADCGQAQCVQAWYHLCPECEGTICPNCKDSIVPGILPGEVADVLCIVVCSQAGDPEMDALLDDSLESLKSSLRYWRDEQRRQQEGVE